MSKYYFRVDGCEENCYTISHWEQTVEDEEADIEIVEAKMTVGGQFFYCQADGAIYERDEGFCGVAACKHYKPRNGKNGICTSYSNCYEPGVVKQLLRYKD